LEDWHGVPEPLVNKRRLRDENRMTVDTLPCGGILSFHFLLAAGITGRRAAEPPGIAVFLSSADHSMTVPIATSGFLLATR
jgi:hypothetical protein